MAKLLCHALNQIKSDLGIPRESEITAVGISYAAAISSTLPIIFSNTIGT
jgi:hypothetical protein